MQPCENTKAGDEGTRLANVEADAEARVGLLPFERFSPTTLVSRGEPQLKICAYRLRMEAEERAQVQKADDLRLEVRRIDIQADKEVQLSQLEIEWGSPCLYPLASSLMNQCLKRHQCVVVLLM